MALSEVHSKSEWRSNAPPKSRSTFYGKWRAYVSPNSHEIIVLIKKGFPAHTFSDITTVFGVTQELLSKSINVSLATISRRKKNNDRFSSDESDKLYRFMKLYLVAKEVLDDDNVIKSWFCSPNSLFEDKTPFEYADTLPGAEEVERVLRRIEHGIPL